MGAKSSKPPKNRPSSSSPLFTTPVLLDIEHQKYFNSLEDDLQSKRPTSRRILDKWNPQSNTPAYALETLDEDLDQTSTVSSTRSPSRRTKATSSVDSGGEALVYVFNPERVRSHRQSKRLSVRDEGLVNDKMSQSPMSGGGRKLGSPNERKNLAEMTGEEECFSLVTPARGVPAGIKSCDSSILGRTGSAANRGLCQDESIFDVGEDTVVFGVFDGHGPEGHVVAAVCAKELASCLRDEQSFYLSQNNMEEVVKGGVASLQRRLDELPPHRADIEYSGSTCTIGYAKAGGEVWMANVGDSRAVGAKREPGNKFSLVKLSDEHILSIPAEAERITNCGGVVRPIIIEDRPIGPLRCWHHNDADLPGLMVSRALGDRCGRSIGLNAEPSYFHVSNLSFVIAASDGLWEVMSSEDAIGFVATTLIKPIPNMELSEILCLEAKRRWIALEKRIGDDISAVVIMFE